MIVDACMYVCVCMGVGVSMVALLTRISHPWLGSLEIECVEQAMRAMKDVTDYSGSNTTTVHQNFTSYLEVACHIGL